MVILVAIHRPTFELGCIADFVLMFGYLLILCTVLAEVVKN